MNRKETRCMSKHKKNRSEPNKTSEQRKTGMSNPNINVNINKKSGKHYNANDTSNRYNAAKYTIPLIEKAKQLGVYKRLCRLVRTLKFTDTTDSTIVQTINELFEFTGATIDVYQFRRSLGSYPELLAAYMCGRTEQLGMVMEYMENYIENASVNDEKAASVVLQYMDRLDNNTIKVQSSVGDINISATGQAIAKLMTALNELDEPSEPDESYLDFDKQAGDDSEEQ